MALTEARPKMQRYLYEHVTSDVLSEDMDFNEDAVGPGDPLPDFDLPTAGGSRFRTTDLVGNVPILVVTGSFTCPMTASSNPMLKQLHAEFGERIAFVMLHVREAHPGERYEQPHTFQEKLEHARKLKVRDALPWPVAADDPEGTVHRAFDGKPNAAFLTDRNGVIVFRSLWAGDEHGLRQALECVARGERPTEPESRRRLVPMAAGIGMMGEMVERSGPRAKRDIWRAAPPMAAMAWMSDWFRPLPPQWRPAAALATVGVATGATLGLVRAAQRR